jgi:hypothetical protein
MDKKASELTVKEIMQMTPSEFALFLDDQAEKAQDRRDEQAQAWRPL